MSNSVVITSAVRTAVGSLGKSLKNVSGDSLGSSVITESINKSQIKNDEIDLQIIERENILISKKKVALLPAK